MSLPSAVDVVDGEELPLRLSTARTFAAIDFERLSSERAAPSSLVKDCAAMTDFDTAPQGARVAISGSENRIAMETHIARLCAASRSIASPHFGTDRFR